MVRYSNILNIGLRSLGFIGQRPDQPKTGMALGIVYLISTIFYELLVFIQLTNLNGDVDLFAKCIEALATFAELAIKLLPLLINRHRLLILIESCKYFWDPEKFCEEIRKEVENMYKVTYYLQTVFTYVVFSTLLLFYTQPFITKELLIECWVPDYPYAFGLLLGGQYFYAFVLAAYVTGFDTLFYSFCTHLCVQMRLVNRSISVISMQDPKYLTKLKACVEHHSFLLRFATEMMTIYNISLLGQYVMSMYLSCMELYLFSESFGNKSRILLSVLYLSCVLFQTALYCFPATAVTEEAADLANYIYDSKWYEGPVALQKNVAFVIMRARKEFKFTAAGLAEINRMAFTVIFKTSISFYTLMRQMKEE